MHSPQERAVETLPVSSTLTRATILFFGRIMLYVITSSTTSVNKNLIFHKFIAYAETESDLKKRFKASKPSHKLLQIQEKNADIMEII